MKRVLFQLILVLFFLTVIIFLQIFLFKRESKWPGLVLPMISFFFGLLYPFSMVTPSDGVTAGFIFQMIMVWLFGNIPTFIFLAVYFGCRGKQRRNQQLDKMSIQDLN